MKIRIHHQEIRFRLSPEDVDTLLRSKSLKETLVFSNEVAWTYHLELDGEKTELSASPLNLKLSLPDSELTEWLESPHIEWIYQQPQPPLALLIEKDLKP